MPDLNKLLTEIASSSLRTTHKGLGAAVLTAAIDLNRGLGKARKIAGTIQQKVDESDSDFRSRVEDAAAQMQALLEADYPAISIETEMTLALG